MQYDPKILIEQVRRTSERALREGKLGIEDSARLRQRYARGLQDYTHLSDDK